MPDVEEQPRMKSLPLISVCIPSYNHEHYIEDAVRSVIGQTYKNWELIIVDDASADSSPELLTGIAAEYPEKIRVILLDENVGNSRAANLAASEAKGEYLAWMGSDDLMHPGRLARQVSFLQKNKAVGAVFSRVNIVDGNGEAVQAGGNIFDKEIGELRFQLLEGNFLNAPSVMMRASVWREVGGFNPELFYVQDYDLWLRFLDNHEIVRLEERLTDYRVHGKNLSICKHEDVAFATHYETAICVLNAIQRWPVEKLFPVPRGLDVKARRTELARGQVCMARLCMNIDMSLFQRPFMGTTYAYQFALEAVRIDPGNDEAQSLIREVYRILGDLPRASREGTLKLQEWHRQGAVPDIAEAADNSQADRESAEAGPAGNNDRLVEQRETAYQEWRKRHVLNARDIALL